MSAQASGGASRSTVIAHRVFTGLFALQMGFTVYAHLCLPQAAQVFARLGFPGYFRLELSAAKLIGLAVLLLPMAPAVMKEWAYAGFAIVLGSALIAHLAVGEGVAAWGWCVGTFVLEALSYYFYRRRLAATNVSSVTRRVEAGERLTASA
jgi:hypothetical protein